MYYVKSHYAKFRLTPNPLFFCFFLWECPSCEQTHPKHHDLNRVGRPSMTAHLPPICPNFKLGINHMYPVCSGLLLLWPLNLCVPELLFDVSGIYTSKEHLHSWINRSAPYDIFINVECKATLKSLFIHPSINLSDVSQGEQK